MMKLEDAIKLRSISSNSINNVSIVLTMLTGGIRCLHDATWLYDLV